jgi:DnaK suppressor protein
MLVGLETSLQANSMKEELLRTMRQQLEGRRAEILQRKSELVADMVDDVPDRKGDTIDITTEEQIDDTRLRIETRFARELTAIDVTLSRLEDGTWGECDECGDDIAVKRMQALPMATLCVDCQEEAETEASRRYKRPGLMDEFNP